MPFDSEIRSRADISLKANFGIGALVRRRTLARMVSGSRLLRLSARWIPSSLLKPFGRPVVLVFHGVVDGIEDPRIELNHHGIDAFAELVRILKTQFDVLPLDVLADVSRQPEKYPRAVFLTSDDGYRNTLTHAADVLDNYRLPWSLFVSTHHIDTGEPNPLFLARLFLLFAPAGRYTIPHLSVPIEIGAEREAVAFATIARLKLLEAAKAREAIAAMSSAFPELELNRLIARFPSERFLSWSDVAALATRGVEIGAHAHWHWPLNDAQTPSYAKDQARTARDRIGLHTGRCRYFAYPFGNVGDVSSAAWQAVRDAGYSCAFTTLSATIDARANPWLLPRYALAQRERNLPCLLPLLRAGNMRLAQWQRRLAA